MLLEADRLTLGLEGGCELELLDLRMSPDIFVVVAEVLVKDWLVG